MKKFEDVKSINFVATFRGNGCVNFDNYANQKFINYEKVLDKNMKNNIVVAKKTYFPSKVDEDGNERTEFKYKVSSDCLRHAIFEETIPVQNPHLAACPYVVLSAIACPDYIMRGWVFVQKDCNSYKDKSALTITDAIETTEEPRKQAFFDFHSSSCSKAAKDEDEDNKDKKHSTAIFNVESVGLLNYWAEGGIDLTELQFISDDPSYDRMALGGLEDGSPEEKYYLAALKKQLGTGDDHHFDYYAINTACTGTNCGERGVLLSKADVNYIVKKTLRQILDININRRSSLFKTTGVKLEIVTSNGIYHEELTHELLDEIEFDYYTKYVPANADIINENRAKFDALANESRSTKGKGK